MSTKLLLPDEPAVPQMESHHYYSGSELLRLRVPARRDLVENLIRKKSLTFLGGEEGCGKSLLALNLALSVSCKQDLFLQYPISRTGPVLYLLYEGDSVDVAERLQKMASVIGDQTLLDNFILWEYPPQLEDCFGDLDAKCREIPPVLIILDCLYYAHSKKEHDNSSMKSVVLQFTGHKLLVTKNGFIEPTPGEVDRKATLPDIINQLSGQTPPVPRVVVPSGVISQPNTRRNNHDAQLLTPLRG